MALLDLEEEELKHYRHVTQMGQASMPEQCQKVFLPTSKRNNYRKRANMLPKLWLTIILNVNLFFYGNNKQNHAPRH